MADWIDVDRVATSLPEVTLRTAKDGIRQWRVEDKPVAWERPLRKADYEALGAQLRVARYSECEPPT